MPPKNTNPYAPPETKVDAQDPLFRFRVVYRIAGQPAFSGKLSIWPQRVERWNAIAGETSVIPMEKVACARIVRHRFQWAIEIAFSSENMDKTDEMALIRWTDYSRFLSPYQRSPLEIVASYLNEHAGLRDRTIPEWPRWHWL